MKTVDLQLQEELQQPESPQTPLLVDTFTITQPNLGDLHEGSGPRKFFCRPDS